MRYFLVFTAIALVLAACAAPPAANPTDEAVLISPEPTAPLGSPTPDAQTRRNVRVDDPNVYRVPQMIPMDGIRPVYNPEFEPGHSVNLESDELVLGVAIEGQAKAYPITVLRVREMVNDELAGIPLLVTW